MVDWRVRDQVVCFTALSCSVFGLLRLGEFLPTGFTPAKTISTIYRHQVHTTYRFRALQTATFNLPFDKSHQFEPAPPVVMGRCGRPFGAVEMLDFYLKSYRIPPQFPLFCSANGTAITAKDVIKFMRGKLLSLGEDPSCTRGTVVAREALRA